ncbi:hypothetical protein BCV70DRAFT_58443 [Testicularia cyperi]|uniref:SH3 domain-containing protein n=1 Tax=Testicularia cyperi TaxID=1882483 RepID=A0A317XXU6_9BASI|nr:hypothetical protein BCV70DRAFT_58443 [Testicularia cyperi]
MRSSQKLRLATAAAPLILAASMASAASDSCISLSGSTMCPSFQTNFIRPSNLSADFGFFEAVSDVTSFDNLFSYYLTSQNQYYNDKIQDGLQCNTTLAQNVTVQWQQTVFCSQFSQASFESGCTAESGEAPALVCQSTCGQYSDSANDIVDNTAYCRSTDELNPFQRNLRSDTLSNDYFTCTNYSSTATSDAATCVNGVENEGSCGFGFSIDQLCNFCDPAFGNTPPSCCYDSKTDLSQCRNWGHPLAATITATTSVPTNIAGVATATSAPSSSITDAASSSKSGSGASSTAFGAEGMVPEGKQLVDADDKVFSKGQIAGIIVGCIVGAALLGALLALLCLRKRGNDHDDPERNDIYGNAGNESHVERPWMQSEEAMVKSPELGRPSQEAKFAGAAGAAGLGVGAAAGAGAIAAGKGRDSADERPNSAMSGETSTDGRGTTIPAVKDQYSSHDICPGETVVAIYPYNAALNDEITLQPDDVVTVQRLYDDGWALGRTEAGGEGAFPLVCVTSTKGGTSSSGEGLGSSGNDGNGTDGNVTADD